MRVHGILLMLALLVAIVGFALFFVTNPLSRGVKLGPDDVPVSEVYTDTDGNWMQYYWDHGKLRWMVIGRNVPLPKVPAENDPRRVEEIYVKLRMPDRNYSMSGGRNFYTLSPKGIKPCPQIIISLDFINLLNRLRTDQEEQGDKFNIITTGVDFFERNYEVKDDLEELAKE